MSQSTQSKEEGFSLVKAIGGLASDAYESVAAVGNLALDAGESVVESIQEAPGKFAEGWKDGAIIDTQAFKESQEQATETKETVTST